MMGSMNFPTKRGAFTIEEFIMGDRAQVHIKDEGVYLYTHWRGHQLPCIVQVAMAKRWRWDDSEYLARIVFEEMIKSDPGGETGFGIGNSEHADVYRVVIIDCANQTVTIVDHGKEVYKSSFEDFITNPVPVGA
jgi:hypothetical protein